MKRWLVIATILGSTQVFAVAANKSFPKMAVKAVHGAALSPKAVQGKVTVVNLWATWCEACKVELKEMEDVFAPLQKNKNFKFAMISLDKNPEKAKNWIRSNLKNPQAAMGNLYLDPEFAFAEKFANDTFPVTLIVDQNGKVVEIHEGYEEKSGQTQQIAKQVQKLLKK